MIRKFRLITVLALIMSLLLVAGCGGQDDAQTEQSQNAPAAMQDIKLGGSSTLATVIAKCADDFTEKYKTWDKVDSSLPEEAVVIFVSTGGSGFGAKSAIQGTVDIGMLARDIKDSEKEKMPNGKVITLGYDALTIAVHPENPVNDIKPNLTTEEVKSIFAGEIKTWQQLDERLPDRPIVLAIRDLGGGASQVFDEKVMKGTPVAKEAIQLPSMGALAAKVVENVDAIGYVSTGLVEQNKGKINVLSVDGVEPTDENIVNGSYKIYRPLLLVTKDTPDQRQQLFINYLLSEEGLQVLADMGFVPVAK